MLSFLHSLFNSQLLQGLSPGLIRSPFSSHVIAYSVYASDALFGTLESPEESKQPAAEAMQFNQNFSEGT